MGVIRMITKYLLPIIKNEDKKLPLYVVTAEHYPQNKVIRPYGIPHYQLLMTLEGSGIVHLGKKKYTFKSGTVDYDGYRKNGAGRAGYLSA